MNTCQEIAPKLQILVPLYNANRVKELISLPLNQGFEKIEALVKREDLRSLIEVAYHSLDEIITGKHPRIERIQVAMNTYGVVIDGICYVCLAGSLFLKATGDVSWKYSKRKYQGLVFLDGLRNLSLKSKSWALLDNYGFKVPDIVEGSTLNKPQWEEDPDIIWMTLSSFLRLNPAES
jgi:hypothetical protein